MIRPRFNVEVDEGSDPYVYLVTLDCCDEVSGTGNSLEAAMLDFDSNLTTAIAAGNKVEALDKVTTVSRFENPDYLFRVEF